MRPKRRPASIFSTAAFSLIGFGISLQISSNSLIETKKVLVTPSTTGEIRFLIMKFSILPRSSCRVSLYGVCGKKGTKEYLKR